MTEALEQSSGRLRSGKSAAAFRTISEVATELEVPQHVLRFWETKFSQVRPLKRAGGRRYYRPEDVDLLRRIRDLLYANGYTIKGVQKLLREGGARALPGSDAAGPEAADRGPANPDPVNPGPANPDPANPDPGNPDPGKPDPGKPEAAEGAAFGTPSGLTAPPRADVPAAIAAVETARLDEELRRALEGLLEELRAARALLSRPT